MHSDGYVWLNVTHKAKDVYSSGLFQLYEVRDDNTEALIQSQEQLNEALENGADICISVGFIYEIISNSTNKDKAMKVTVEQLQAIASVSPDGFTVRKDGSVVTPENNEKAYACALSITKGFKGIEKAQAALDLVNQHPQLFAGVGGWVDSEGQLLVEPVMFLPKDVFDLGQARCFGVLQQQDALFDLETFTSIDLVKVQA